LSNNDARPDAGAFTNPSDQDIVEWLPRRVADRRIRYGTDPLQFGDLRLPAGQAPAGGWPVAVVVHGGGFSANWNLDHGARLAERLTDAVGIATWSLEYRRPGQRGAGWPGTWLDIALGIDQLRAVAGAGLDLGRVIAIGHSAGATFAVWAAARGSIPFGSKLHVPDPLALAGVVSLAGMLDLRSLLVASDDPSANLMGILTADAADGMAELLARCPDVSPFEVWPHITVPQHLIVGGRDAEVMIEQTRSYAAALRGGERADEFVLDYLDGANHFDLIDPSSAAWSTVARACASLLDLELPDEALEPS
jgi:acetyl esterase/lipase